MKTMSVPFFRRHVAGLDGTANNAFLSFVTKNHHHELQREYFNRDERVSEYREQRKARRHSGKGIPPE